MDNPLSEVWDGKGGQAARSAICWINRELDRIREEAPMEWRRVTRRRDLKEGMAARILWPKREAASAVREAKVLEDRELPRVQGVEVNPKTAPELFEWKQGVLEHHSAFQDEAWWIRFLDGARVEITNLGMLQTMREKA